MRRRRAEGVSGIFQMYLSGSVVSMWFSWMLNWTYPFLPSTCCTCFINYFLTLINLLIEEMRFKELQLCVNKEDMDRSVCVVPCAEDHILL